MGMLGTFREVSARSSQKVDNIRIAVKSILMNVPACYDEMEPYLLPAGVRGSKPFDQAEAVNILKRHDKEKVLVDFGFNDRMLWDHLSVVLARNGYRVANGRIIGLLEHDKHREDKPEVMVEAAA